jgi:hypothetical protein
MLDREQLAADRIRAVEALAATYMNGSPPKQGYYGNFLAKLAYVVLGAAEDFGMKPIGFYVVGHIAPLAEELTTLNAASRIPSMASAAAARVFLKNALASVDRVEGGEGFSL